MGKIQMQSQKNLLLKTVSSLANQEVQQTPDEEEIEYCLLVRACLCIYHFFKLLFCCLTCCLCCTYEETKARGISRAETSYPSTQIMSD
jgi:hypothetical protein